MLTVLLEKSPSWNYPRWTPLDSLPEFLSPAGRKPLLARNRALTLNTMRRSNRDFVGDNIRAVTAPSKEGKTINGRFYQSLTGCGACSLYASALLALLAAGRVRRIVYGHCRLDLRRDGDTRVVYVSDDAVTGRTVCLVPRRIPEVWATFLATVVIKSSLSGLCNVVLMERICADRSGFAVHPCMCLVRGTSDRFGGVLIRAHLGSSFGVAAASSCCIAILRFLLSTTTDHKLQSFTNGLKMISRILLKCSGAFKLEHRRPKPRICLVGSPQGHGAA